MSDDDEDDMEKTQIFLPGAKRPVPPPPQPPSTAPDAGAAGKPGATGKKSAVDFDITAGSAFDADQAASEPAAKTAAAGVKAGADASATKTTTRTAAAGSAAKTAKKPVRKPPPVTASSSNSGMVLVVLAIIALVGYFLLR